MSERDPRVDPQPGDVLGKGDSRVHVERALLGMFAYSFEGKAGDAPPMVHWSDDWRSTWRKWAATATVIRRADGTGKRGV